VKLVFQSIGRFGGVKHRMDIYTNDPSEQVRHIPIRAKVKRAFELDPQSLDFGTVDRTSRSTQTVRVTSMGVGGVSIKGIENLPPYLSYTTEKLDEKGVEGCLLHLHCQGELPVGKHSFRLKVRVENEKVEDFALYVDLMVFPSIVFKYDENRIFNHLDLGLLKPGVEKQVTIEVLNTDLAVPYPIKNIQCRSKCTPPVEVSLHTEDIGMRYLIHMKISSAVKQRFLKGRLMIYSDHPDLPLAVIQFKGMYKTP
jgi:hypothetical protein